MAATSSIVDDFSGSLNTTRWPANNQVTVAGGQAVLTCNTDYADLSSAFSYTFDSAYAKVTPAAANGGTTGNCYLRMALVANGQADGTFLGIVCDTIEGTIYFQKAVGYWDDNGPGITYSPTAHAWWKIALSGTNVVFSTSPDGTTWTARYTTARPTYYNSSSFQLTFEAHRDSGTANTAIVDNVNTTATVTVVTGALALSASAIETVAGIGKSTGVLHPTAAGALAAAGFAKATGGSTLGATGMFTAAGKGTALGQLALAAAAGIEATGGRIMAPNLGEDLMTASGSFSLAVDGAVTSFGQLAGAGNSDMTVAPGVREAFAQLDLAGLAALSAGPSQSQTGELVLAGTSEYMQWTSKTVIPIAFGYLTGEVDA
jgi:hypothetical protein